MAERERAHAKRRRERERERERDSELEHERERERKRESARARRSHVAAFWRAPQHQGLAAKASATSSYHHRVATMSKLHASSVNYKGGTRHIKKKTRCQRAAVCGDAERT